MLKQKRNITKAYFDYARKKYAPLINKLAFNIGVNASHTEELQTQGLKELVRCMLCYNGSSAFMTFFYGRLECIFKHMRDSERRTNKVQLLDSTSMMSMARHNHDIDSDMMARECMECLNSNEHNVITRFFFEKQTTKEISKDIGMVIPAVCKIKRVAIKKMRQKYGEKSE